MARLSLCGQVGHDFAHHAAELESVARKSRRDKHVWKAGQGVDDEVLVRRVREHAGREGHRRPVRVGEVAGDGLAQHRLVLIAAVSIQALRGCRFIQVVKLANLETRHTERREGIVIPFFELANHDRAFIRREELRPQRLEPAHHLALGHQQMVQRRH